MTLWFENEEFWSTFKDVLFAPTRWEAAREGVEMLLARTGTPRGARVLDLCCGPGRHALEFARRGFQVTGVDRTEAYLREGSERARAEGLAVEFVLEDMRRFERPGAFDLAVNLFTSFGYFEDSADDLLVARHLYAALRPGGRLVIETVGKEVIARSFRPIDCSWVDDERRTLLVEERSLDGEWGRIETTWTLFSDAGRVSHSFRLRLYSATELIALLRAAGFGSISVFGGLDGSAYDAGARRLVAVAAKGEGRE